MRWISDMFSWEMVALAVMAVLFVAALVLIRRIHRGGLGTFEQSYSRMERRISGTGAEIRDRNLAMPAGEQLHILEAALRELLELEGKPQGYAVHRTARSLCLTTPTGEADIIYAVRQAMLRSAGRVMRGAAHWEVRLGGEVQSFPDLALLMRHLRGVVSPQKSFSAEVSTHPPLGRLKNRS